MRTLRLSLAGTIILALLGGVGGVVVAQSEDARSAVWLTFTEQDCVVGDHEPATIVDGVEQLRGMPRTCQLTSADARVSGVQNNIINHDCFDSGICIFWGTQEVVGPDGTWSGWFNGTIDPDGNGHGHVVLTGAGGYEGLVNVRHALGPIDAMPTQYGVVYEADTPPIVALPAE
jgi:hypothetical protein